MSNEMTITVKHRQNNAAFAAGANSEPQIWSKSVTGIDMSKPGGFCLVGSFHGSNSRLDQDGMKYEAPINNYIDSISIACVKMGQGAARRAVFMFAPASLHSEMPANYSNAIIASSPGIVFQARMTIDDVDIEVKTGTNKLFIVGFIDHESAINKNSLVSAAEFIDSIITPAAHKRNLATLMVTPSASPSPSPSPDDPRVDPKSGLVPVSDVKKQNQETRKGKKKKKTVSKIAFTKRPKLPVPGKGITLPDSVEFMADIDGIKILIVNGKPRFMHTLADFENVSDELRSVILEQALELAGLAEAYKLVGMMGKDKIDKGD